MMPQSRRVSSLESAGGRQGVRVPPKTAALQTINSLARWSPHWKCKTSPELERSVQHCWGKVCIAGRSRIRAGDRRYQSMQLMIALIAFPRRVVWHAVGDQPCVVLAGILQRLVVGEFEVLDDGFAVDDVTRRDGTAPPGRARTSSIAGRCRPPRANPSSGCPRSR